MKYVSILIFLCLSLVPTSGFAQKKQLSQARDYLKSGKNLDKAESLMREQLKDSTKRGNIKLWSVLADVLRKEYEQGNEKLYLKEKYDTAALFNNARQLFAVMESLDSLDVRPDSKGRIHPKFRDNHAEYLAAIRPNLFYGGAYFMKGQKYSEAYDYFNHYIISASHPIFTGYKLPENDTLASRAAYWTMYCGFKLNSDSLIMVHHNLAEHDTAHIAFVRQYEAEAYRLRNDTADYVRALKAGFAEYPKFPFFFPRLVEYYSMSEKQDSVLATAEQALRVDSTSQLFLLAKSTALLNLGRYDECIKICRQLTEAGDTIPDAYLNMGLAYFNQAIQLDKVRQRHQSNRTKIRDNYRKALPYLEKFRSLAPDQKDKWISPLYVIYLNLNMGDEFDEIEKIRNEYRRNNR